MSDRIVLRNMRFRAGTATTTGAREPAALRGRRRARARTCSPPGVDDDLEKTIDYGRVYAIARQIVESTSFRLLEAHRRGDQPRDPRRVRVTEVGVRVRKPEVQLGGPLDHAAVEIWRRRR